MLHLEGAMRAYGIAQTIPPLAGEIDPTFYRLHGIR